MASLGLSFQKRSVRFFPSSASRMKPCPAASVQNQNVKCRPRFTGSDLVFGRLYGNQIAPKPHRLWRGFTRVPTTREPGSAWRMERAGGMRLLDQVICFDVSLDRVSMLGVPGMAKKRRCNLDCAASIILLLSGIDAEWSRQR